MQISNLNLNLIRRRNTVMYIFAIHYIIMIAILIFLIVTGRDYSDFLLRDDGYYLMSKNFFNGEFNPGSIIGPGLPMIFTPIHFFPLSWHPFVRLFISQLFVLILLILLSDLTKKILTNRQYFWGSLIVVIHPVFIHWSFRTSVDLYLAIMLGGFILYFIKYYQDPKLKYLIISFVFFGYGIFTRPSFLLVPLVILFISLIYRNFKNIRIVGIVLLIFCLTCFYFNNLYLEYNSEIDNKSKLTIDDGRTNLIIHSFLLTETILKTKQFHKGTVDEYRINDSLRGASYIYKNVDKYVSNYTEKYPNGNFIHMTLIYCKKNPDILLAKILLSPIFFFTLSSREIMSYLLMVLTIVYFIISIMGIKISLNQQELSSFYIILLSILFGYLLLHWITHSYSRYSLVVLPYIYIWGGKYIDKLYVKLTGRINRRNKSNEY